MDEGEKQMTTKQKNTPDSFEVGDLLDWRHGDSIRIAKVLCIEGSWVLVQGSSKEYWISKKQLHEKITKPLNYPLGGF